LGGVHPRCTRLPALPLAHVARTHPGPGRPRLDRRRAAEVASVLHPRYQANEQIRGRRGQRVRPTGSRALGRGQSEQEADERTISRHASACSVPHEAAVLCRRRVERSTPAADSQAGFSVRRLQGRTGWLVTGVSCSRCGTGRISRDQLTAFIDANTHTAYPPLADLGGGGGTVEDGRPGSLWQAGNGLLPALW